MKANLDRITVALLRARRSAGADVERTVAPRLDRPRTSTAAAAALRTDLAGFPRLVPPPAPSKAEGIGAKGIDTEARRAPTSLVPLEDALASVRRSKSSRIRYTRSRVVKVSHQHFEEKRVAVDPTHHELLDAVRVLRTQVLQRMRENGWQTLAVVSPSSDDGKSLVAVNLATSIAMEMNHTALLVDANMRRPSVHSYFGLSRKPGLAHHLVKNAPVETLLVNPGINRLLVMPAGAALQNSAELLASDKMQELVDQLKHRYAERIVIFDLPPLLHSADALAFLPFIDATLLVVGDGITARDEIQRAESLLANANLIGVTLNFSRERAANLRRRPGFFRRLFNLS